MLCFGRLRPGLLDFMRRQALRQNEIDRAERRGRYFAPPTADRPQGNRLLEIYNRKREEIRKALGDED
jgi:hypothetical protein